MSAASPRNDWDEAYDQLEEMRLSAERSGAAPDDWGVTKAEVAALSRRAAQAQRAAALAAYRSSHPELNPHASDKTVDALIYLHGQGGQAAATAAHSGETRDTREQRKP